MLVLTHLRPHLLGCANFSQFQSAYRKGHSTETALLEVPDRVYTADIRQQTVRFRDKQVTVLICLDLPTAFDTHGIQFGRLQSDFVVRETPLAWLQSYLEGRTQFFKLRRHQSRVVKLEGAVPPRSVLGSLLFAVYCSSVGDIITDHGVLYNQYADDTQLHFAMSVDNATAGLSVLAACTADVRKWYLQNGLLLNRDKLEALVVGTASQLCRRLIYIISIRRRCGSSGG